MTDQVPLTRLPRRVRLRVEDYLALDRAGAFDAYGRTALLDGDVHYVNSHHRPHARVLARLFGAIRAAVRDRSDGPEALMDASIAMPPHNVPQPDVVLTREPEGEGLIPLSSVALAVEVSDTSLRHDLGRKRRIYARGA
ncbi:Uma2 family endonuclease [Sphingomonas sp. DT-51]|uniref:Uma2 family endonuclease n=1 Tax=Sphingomonas sp. DT-51 TaxID=3396165 RepID=UPI003F19F231